MMAVSSLLPTFVAALLFTMSTSAAPSIIPITDLCNSPNTHCIL